MKELTNSVRITGQLVKNTIMEGKDKKGNDAIKGDLIIRTADDSEHEVRFFTHTYKKDENRNFTQEKSYFYPIYKEAMETLKDIEHCATGENPDIISITASFTDNDFKGSDGTVISNNKIFGRFINKIEPKDYESTVLESRFEVEGIIDKIEDEISKGIPTGNLIIKINAIGQTYGTSNGNDVYSADHLIPIEMVVDKSMAEAFRSAGYYEGAFAKFAGTIINTVEVVKQVEKAAFGADIEKEIRTYIRKNEIKSGTAPMSIYEVDLTDDIVNALKAKRKAKLEEVKNGTNDSNSNNATTTVAPQMNYNPFASTNPFMQG